MVDRLQKIEAVIFDLDGVLINSEWLAFGIWQEWTEQCGGKLEEAAFAEMIGTTAEETAVIVQRWTGLSFGIAESCDWTWEQLSSRLKQEIKPLPGAAELVRALAARGVPLAIASNAPSEYIFNALTGLDLLRYFPIRVGIDQVAEGKPAPEVYLRAASLLNMTPEQCLAVEDSSVGVTAAAAAGMRVLAVPTHRNGHKGFEQAWRIYESLVPVEKELDRIFSE